MSERFMVDDAGTLIDMHTRDMFDIVEEVVELLNELHEENQDLELKLAEKHHDLTELGLKYGDIIDIKIANEVIENQRKHIKKAEKENEQLKAHNQYLIELLESTGAIVEIYKGDLE